MKTGRAVRGALALLVAGLSLLVPTIAPAQSLRFTSNAEREFEYAVLPTLPAGFGAGEFTLQFRAKLAAARVGSTESGSGQRQYWSSTDPRPYSSDDWWWHGNFLLDGHNNSDFAAGTFSVQVYGGGRIRWLFGDGLSAKPGRLWAVQAHPAHSTPSLLDDRWHRVTLVRRSVSPPASRLELWVDGQLIATEQSPQLVDMSSWWSTWQGFPSDQHGWYWGSEKQAAIGKIAQWEDFKGLIADIRFWNAAVAPELIRRDTSPAPAALVAFGAACTGASRESCMVSGRIPAPIDLTEPPARIALP